MSLCHKSVQYVRGNNNESIPHYLVELTEKHLNVFELLSSLNSLDKYDSLLFFLECQLYNNNSKSPPIPPFDIILTLLTLSTVSPHYKEPQLRKSDPYDMTRIPLNRRAIKILKFYTEILKNFNTNIYNVYDLELLRCQFFLAIDTLSPKKNTWNSTNYRRKFENDDNFDKDSLKKSIVNPYRAYIDSFDKKKVILNNIQLNLKLNQPGEFLNMFLWTLNTSLSDDSISYISSNDIWMPLLDIILDLFALRQQYFLRNEVARMKKSLFIQRLIESPMVRFFGIIDSRNFNIDFPTFLLLNCNIDQYQDSSIKDDIHFIYYNEMAFSKTFIPRVKYPRNYKLKKSMYLRKKILANCFNLLTTIPPGRTIPTLKMEAEGILVNISKLLLNFENIDEFNSFLEIYDMEIELAFMPVIIEKVINTMAKSICEDAFNLVNQIVSMKHFIREWIAVNDTLLDILIVNIDGRKNSIKDIFKLEKCLVILFQYFELIHSKDLIQNSKYFQDLIKRISSSNKQIFRNCENNSIHMEIDKTPFVEQFKHYN